MFRALLLFFFLISVQFSFAQEKTYPKTLERKIVRVGKGEFKLKVEEISPSEYKIRVSKKVNKKWQLQNRHKVSSDNYLGYKLLDWNNDGHLDIKVHFIAGGAGEAEDRLFLYNTETRKYTYINKYYWYSGSYETETRITNNYHFSFIYWGCAGDSYEAPLFTLENFKLIKLGSIHVNYCEPPYNLIIYKCHRDGRTTKVATISADYISKHYTKEDDDYLAWQHYVINYWTKHYKEYIE